LKPEDNLQRFAIGRLISAVHVAVGSPSYNKISLLLEEAFVAANCKPSISLDEDNLRIYYTKIYKRLLGPTPAAAGKTNHSRRSPLNTEI
jgi:hypothetical protein